jgi:hypothetical protein
LAHLLGNNLKADQVSRIELWPGIKYHVIGSDVQVGLSGRRWDDRLGGLRGAGLDRRRLGLRRASVDRRRCGFKSDGSATASCEEQRDQEYLPAGPHR